MIDQPVPTVSVIIPAYKITAYIRDTIDSVLKQTFTNFEIIVVNDNCPDTINLERVLKPYRSRIVYLKNHSNLGPSDTRNTGLIASRGEFVALLDGDDLWEPDYLSKQIAMLRLHPAADVIYCDGLIFGDARDAGKTLMTLSPSNGPVTLISLFNQEVQVIISVLAKRESLIKVGLFDRELRRAEDFDLWVRIAKSGGIIIYQRELLMRYRRRVDSLSDDSVKMLESAIFVAYKTLKRNDLSLEERRVVQGTAARWTANLCLEHGKQYFREGDYKKASTLISEANRFQRRWKLRIVILLLNWTPGLWHRLRRS